MTAPSVFRPEPALQGGAIGPGQRAGQDGERSAHEGGGHEEDEGGEAEPQGQAPERSGPEGRGGTDVGVAGESEDQR